MEIKITKRKPLKEWSNYISDGYAILVYGRIINDENTFYKCFKFIVYVDTNDVWDGYFSRFEDEKLKKQNPMKIILINISKNT